MTAQGNDYRASEGGQETPSCSGLLGSLARSLLNIWVMYFALFAALLGVTMLLGLMPQFVSLRYISGTGLGAMVLQLVAYPLLAGFQALKVQVLVGVFEEAGDGFPRPLAALHAALRLSTTAAERGATVLLGLSVALGLGFGVWWTVQGDPLGLLSGFMTGSLLGFSVLATVRIFVELVVSISSAGSKERRPLDLETASEEEQPSGSCRSMLVGVAWLCFTILLQLGVALLAWKFSVSSLLTSAAMVVAFVTTGFGLSQIFSGLVKRRLQSFPITTPFRMVVGLFALGPLFLSVMPNILGSEPDLSWRLSTPLFSPPPSGTAFNRSLVPPGLLSGDGTYPACHNMEWNKARDDEAKHLQLLDIVAFARAVYHPVEADVISEVRNATLGTDLGEVHLEALEDPNAIARIAVFTLPQARARVVAIRGSSTADDWFFNLDLWGPSSFFLVLRAFMPFAELVPVDFVRNVLALDLREFAGLPPPWRRLQERVREAAARSREDGFRLLVTGHSLGGGMAQIVGPMEGVPTVVFSPVGISLTAARTGLSGSRELPVENTVVAISPYGDPVPSAIDDQLGMKQRIMCTARNPGDCHSLRQSACELFRRCGDPRGRSMEAACLQQVGEDWQAVPWLGFAWRS